MTSVLSTKSAQNEHLLLLAPGIGESHRSCWGIAPDHSNANAPWLTADVPRPLPQKNLLML